MLYEFRSSSTLSAVGYLKTWAHLPLPKFPLSLYTTQRLCSFHWTEKPGHTAALETSSCGIEETEPPRSRACH